MNVNITGIYDNTVIVDTNLFEDVRLLQTGLSSLSDTLFDVVQGLPYKYANLTTFTILSDDYDAFKITNNSKLSTIYSDIDNLTTNLSVLNVDQDRAKRAEAETVHGSLFIHKFPLPISPGNRIRGPEPGSGR